MVPAAPAAQQPAAQPPPPQQPPPGGPAASPLEALVAATEDEVDLSSSRRASFDDILDKVAGSLGDEPSSLGATLPAEPPRHAPEPPHHAPQPAAAPATPGRHLRSSALERPVVEARPWSAPGQRPPAPDGALTEQLELLGFPAGLIEQAATAPRTLLEAFALATSPRALPRTPGSLVAVVGSTQVAKRIAELCGVPAVELARARRWRADHEASSPLVVHDAYEAADLAPGWRRDRVAVVALAVSSAGRDGAWARQLLRALAPSMTIAVASATTKPEDVAATCEAIGGADALVLEDVDATLTPAASLSAGIPVGMLDGLPADAATWVAVASRALARRGARA